jgi:hypothetical protein
MTSKRGYKRMERGSVGVLTASQATNASDRQHSAIERLLTYFPYVALLPHPATCCRDLWAQTHNPLGVGSNSVQRIQQ